MSFYLEINDLNNIKTMLYNLFDYKELSSLIYACPLGGKVSLIQTAGRVLRECPGKMAPRIRLLVDLTFPTQFLPEYHRAKKIFKSEFGSDVKLTDVEEGA